MNVIPTQEESNHRPTDTGNGGFPCDQVAIRSLLRRDDVFAGLPLPVDVHAADFALIVLI